MKIWILTTRFVTFNLSHYNSSKATKKTRKPSEQNERVKKKNVASDKKQYQQRNNLSRIGVAATANNHQFIQFMISACWVCNPAT